MTVRLAVVSRRPTTDAEDLVLVERARAGDQEAWAALWRAHQPALLGYARRRVAQDADAEDVCAAVWERFLQDVRRGGRGITPRRWLMQLVRWELWEAHHQTGGRRHVVRRRPAHVGLEDVAPVQPSLAPVDVAAEVASRLEVARLLGALSPAARAAIAGRYVLDLDAAATAVRLGSSPGAVIQRCLSGRRRLQALLASRPAASQPSARTSATAASEAERAS